ncbi:MAG: MFS transporter [Proteobacteria bacterium]|nr:MFS transporter [Pseudomonadota bacterium]MBU1716494.1 MFS transporter [Pseudomonadota bacterium]
MTGEERKLTWLAGFSHFITHGYMTLLPAALVVITAEHSISFMDIGIIANIGYFLYGLGSFPAGYLSDKLGSKRMLTVGVFGMAISSILVGFSRSMTGFAITYALLGTFASIHHPAGLSLIARRVELNKGKALGIHGVMGNAGLFLTPLIAGLGIMYFQSWRAAYVIYGVAGLFFGIILYFSRVEQEKDLCWREVLALPGQIFKAESSRLSAQTKLMPLRYKNSEQGQAAGQTDQSTQDKVNILPVSLLLLYAGSILSGFIFRGSLTFFPALLKQEVHFITSHDEPVVIAGYVTSAVLSMGLIGSWFGGYINDKIKRPELFPLNIFAIVAPALYLLSHFTDSWLLATACVFSLVYYAWQPSHNYLIAKYTRKASHGMGFGINFFLIFGVGSIATTIGGYVADDYGVDYFYMIMAFVAIAALLAGFGVWMVRHHSIRFAWRVVKDSN